MASVNRAILIGHVGQDPEKKEFANGGSIVSFSLATSEKWKTKAGEKKEVTHWHRVVVQSEQVQDIVMKYVKKGSKLYVEGMIAQRSWTNDAGEQRHATEIAVKGFGGRIQLLDAKKREDEAPDDTYETE